MITVLCPFGLDAGLVTKAAQLDSQVRVLLPQKEQTQAALYGAAYIHTLPEGFSVADEGAFAKWLKDKVLSWNSTVILAPATVQMRNIMPLLAALLQAGLTADCTGLSMEDGKLLQTRPAFGNSLMADIVTLTDIQLATVRPGTFRPAENRKTPQITPENPTFESRVQDLGFAEFETGAPLSQAKIIVAGGLGIGSKEGFEKLSRLAQKLGGAVAASRAAVDAGFAPYHCQVGITGVTVCPDLYIAVGISGAVLLLSGMSGAQKIIAVISDPKAPFFDYADYGFVGDWETTINKLEELL